MADQRRDNSHAASSNHNDGSRNQQPDLQAWAQRQNNLERTMQELLRTVQQLAQNQPGARPQNVEPQEEHGDTGSNHAPSANQSSHDRSRPRRERTRSGGAPRNNRNRPLILVDDSGQRQVQFSRNRNEQSMNNPSRGHHDLREDLHRAREARAPENQSRGRSPQRRNGRLGSISSRPPRRGTPVGSAARTAEQDAGIRDLTRRLRRLEQLEQRRQITGEPLNGYTEHGPFAPEISNEPLPDRFKMPSIPTYEAASDPYNHLDVFNVQMDLVTTNDRVKCRFFPATLGEIPRKWLRELPSGSISSWKQCQEIFLRQYQALRRQSAPLCHLATIHQKSGEQLKDYLSRFQREASYVDNPSDESMLIAISAGLDEDNRFYKSFYKSPVRTLYEFYERAQQYIRIEEMFGPDRAAHDKMTEEKSTSSDTASS